MFPSDVFSGVEVAENGNNQVKFKYVKCTFHHSCALNGISIKLVDLFILRMSFICFCKQTLHIESVY